MFKNNQMISNLELFAIGAMIGNALFVGMGNAIIVLTAKRDTWIVGLLSILAGLFIVGLLCKIMNYEPSMNLIEKINHMFGKKIGLFINLIISLLIVGTLLIDISGLGVFANTKYLTETPLYFIVLLFLIAIVFSYQKGIEAIARTTLFLFFIGVICHFTITTSLFEFIDFKNVKPTLMDGWMPIINGVAKFLTYAIIPFLSILIIPKDHIKNSKHSSLALLLGYAFTAGIMSIVFFMDMSTVGYAIAAMYRYPEYFIMKKVHIINSFDNIENVFSVVWIYNMVVCAMMEFYYINEYIGSFFKNRTSRKKMLIALGVGGFILLSTCKLFPNATAENTFMDEKYPIVFGIPALCTIFLIFIMTFFKKKKST